MRRWEARAGEKPGKLGVSIGESIRSVYGRSLEQLGDARRWRLPCSDFFAFNLVGSFVRCTRAQHAGLPDGRPGAKHPKHRADLGVRSVKHLALTHPIRRSWADPGNADVSGAGPPREKIRAGRNSPAFPRDRY
jgi:hypothetical protein